MNTGAEHKTYLVFWNVQGDPGTLEDLLKVKADVRVSLGNLISEDFDDDDVRYSIYCMALAKYYGCQILKGENERIYSELKGFAHPRVQDELKELPSLIQKEDLAFLSRMPIPPTSDDDKIIKEKLKKLNKPILHLTDQELAEIYGKLVSKNIDHLQYGYQKGEIFFVGGRKECAVWQRVISTACPTSIYDLLGEDSGSEELDLASSSVYLISPGDANEGCYCTLTMPEKKLTLYSV